MKRITTYLFCILVITFCSAKAQVTSNGMIQPKEGIVFGYTAVDNGQAIKFPVKIISMKGSGITFQYTVSHGSQSFSGKMIVSKEGIENGTNLNSQDLNPGEQRMLAQDQTIFLFSKTFFSQLLKTKTATYNGTEYTLSETPKGTEIIIGGTRISAVYIYSAKAKTAYWILNNPGFPLILKSSGSKNGPDFTLATVSIS